MALAQPTTLVGREQLIALVFGTVCCPPRAVRKFALVGETVATLTSRHIVSRLKNCKPN